MARKLRAPSWVTARTIHGRRASEPATRSSRVLPRSSVQPSTPDGSDSSAPSLMPRTTDHRHCRAMASRANAADSMSTMSARLRAASSRLASTVASGACTAMQRTRGSFVRRRGTYSMVASSSTMDEISTASPEGTEGRRLPATPARTTVEPAGGPPWRAHAATAAAPGPQHARFQPRAAASRRRADRSNSSGQTMYMACRAWVYSPPHSPAPSSSPVQDTSLSRMEQGFESPWGHSPRRPVQASELSKAARPRGSVTTGPIV